MTHPHESSGGPSPRGRRGWLVVLIGCLLGLAAVLVVALRSTAGAHRLLPFLLAVPLVIGVRVSWRKLQR